MRKWDVATYSALRTLSSSGSTKYRKSAETSSVAQKAVATGTPQRHKRFGGCFYVNDVMKQGTLENKGVKESSDSGKGA